MNWSLHQQKALSIEITAMKRFILWIAAVLLLGFRCGAQQLEFRNVTIEGKEKPVSADNIPLFIDVKPNSGPLGTEYGVELAVQNTGSDIRVTDATVRVYAGSFQKEVPSNASILQIDASEVCV